MIEFRFCFSGTHFWQRTSVCNSIASHWILIPFSTKESTQGENWKTLFQSRQQQRDTDATNTRWIINWAFCLAVIDAGIKKKQHAGSQTCKKLGGRVRIFLLRRNIINPIISGRPKLDASRSYYDWNARVCGFVCQCGGWGIPNINKRIYIYMCVCSGVWSSKSGGEREKIGGARHAQRGSARHNWKNIKKQLPWRDLSIGPLIAWCAYRRHSTHTQRHLKHFASALPLNSSWLQQPHAFETLESSAIFKWGLILIVMTTSKHLNIT